MLNFYCNWTSVGGNGILKKYSSFPELCLHELKTLL